MAKFKIKETVKQMRAFIYEVEANSEEEALDKYINELAGSLEHDIDFIVPDLEESIVVYSE